MTEKDEGPEFVCYSKEVEPVGDYEQQMGAAIRGTLGSSRNKRIEELEEAVQVLGLQKAQVVAELEAAQAGKAAMEERNSIERERRQWAETRVDELIKVCEEKQGRIERMETALRDIARGEFGATRIPPDTGDIFLALNTKAREALEEVKHAS